MTESNGSAPAAAPTTHQSDGALDRFFHISARGSSVGTEIRAGVVTFFAMAYIIILNPLIIGTTADINGDTLGIPQVAAVTALAAGVMTIAFGVIARYPFGIATGLGINTLVAVTLVATEGLTWPEAMGLVVIDGIIIVILAVSGFRVAVFEAIPHSLKAAMGVGIGLFIALIGLVDAGFVRRIPDAAGTTVPVGLGINGSIGSWPTFVFCAGLIICGILVTRRVRGGLFIGIVATTVIAMIVEALTDSGPSFVDGKPVPTGWSLAVPQLPDTVGGAPDLSLVGAVDLIGAFSRIGVLAASLLVFTLVLANFFDAMGTMTALGKQGRLVDENGNLPDMKRALIVEGAGAIVGGGVSASSNTVYIDSAAGIADGARTGLANVVTGILFLAAMFLTPLYEVVPIEAAAPVLVVVGAMMMGQVVDIDFTEFHIALPAFLTIVIMPFTYSIANGIGVGFIAYVLMALAGGQAKKVHWLLWLISALFMVYFTIDPVMHAIA
ncbi:NCS2 family permease [Corynebacterium sp. CCM 8835]|uniref:NCS2 family permease n=1 Tax=Corynebacterium antarcticum TaxID=2800405 RepID=A0A9Q4GM88_9CORY|nr:NCS2 family permease [Corynebacterium antarcticum]MCK7642738.1 NCS2 family permease [Corynebacterium antarcticum]MCK7661224.1 NCS2 family permease [Corynebacterium antarcticum]MCL0245977.1 NCS2 family permease [Corynebacterium antarcticum]MCX7492225.1 NCS2 family permease [Corynebacterium antarcticum]MCX7538658.1 NCS2 family permease [Corynebacterium antarcticum]